MIVFSLNVNLKSFYGNIFVKCTLISADPHLDVVSGGAWQLLVEPRRGVEGTASSLRPAASTVPQRVAAVEDFKHPCCSRPRIAEIIIPNKGWWRHNKCILIRDVIAGAHSLGESFTNSRHKGPNMLPWAAMSETNAIHIVRINRSS